MTAERKRLILLAALSYAYSNCDDLNEAMETGDGNILVGSSVTWPITENELDELMLE